MMAFQSVFEIAQKEAVVRVVVSERNDPSCLQNYEIVTSIWIWTNVVRIGSTGSETDRPYLHLWAEYHQVHWRMEKKWGCTFMKPQKFSEANLRSFLRISRELTRFLSEPVRAKAARDELGTNQLLTQLAVCNPVLLPMYSHLLALIDHGQAVNDSGTIAEPDRAIIRDRFGRFVFDQIDQFSRVL